MSTEIKGQEYHGWTHTLEIEVDGSTVVVDTYWRKREPAEAAVTPVALAPAEALRAAAALIHAAYSAVKDAPDLEQATVLERACHDVAAPLAEMRGWIDGLRGTKP